jgi:hypothetical protein
MGKPEGKRPLGKPRRRWMNNIKIDLKEIGWDGVDWIDLAQDRDQVEGPCEHGNETWGSLNCLEVSLDIAMKPKAQYTIFTADIILFILQTKYLNKICKFLKI